MPSIFFYIPLLIGTFQQLDLATLWGPWFSQWDATPNIQANPTATADFHLVLIRITFIDGRCMLFTYKYDSECDWLTLNTANPPIMKGCADLCNKSDFCLLEDQVKDGTNVIMCCYFCLYISKMCNFIGVYRLFISTVVSDL